MRQSALKRNVICRGGNLGVVHVAPTTKKLNFGSGRMRKIERK
jgi:hypothetical protein